MNAMPNSAAELSSLANSCRRAASSSGMRAPHKAVKREGVVIVPERGVVKGMFGVAEETSDVSLACRQWGPIKFKRQLELPASGVERTYRARAFGDISQTQLEDLVEGIEIDGVRYGKIDANLERRTGRNQWVEMTLTEGKNREVRKVLEHFGLQVSRLITKPVEFTEVLDVVHEFCPQDRQV